MAGLTLYDQTHNTLWLGTLCSIVIFGLIVISVCDEFRKVLFISNNTQHFIVVDSMH